MVSILQDEIKRTGLTIDSTAETIEFPVTGSGIGYDYHAYCTVSNDSSLSAGIIRLEAFNEENDTWQGVTQTVNLLASGGGTPEVVNGNTASTTAIVGGVAVNTTGITALSDTATVILKAKCPGQKVRLYFAATSGTADLSVVLQTIVAQ